MLLMVVQVVEPKNDSYCFYASITRDRRSASAEVWEQFDIVLANRVCEPIDVSCEMYNFEERFRVYCRGFFW